MTEILEVMPTNGGYSLQDENGEELYSTGFGVDRLEDMVRYGEQMLSADVRINPEIITGRVRPYTFAVLPDLGDEYPLTVTGDGRSILEARWNAATHLEDGETLGELLRSPEDSF